MAKPYRKLRHKMDDMDVSRKDVAKQINRHVTYVDQRLRCEHSWTIQDAYRILKFLNVSPDEISDYFPDEKIKSRGA